MAEIKNLVITVSRKVSANYNVREAGYMATVELGAGDDPRDVLNTWTARLQTMCDQAVGDPQGPTSFKHTTRYEPVAPKAS